MPTAKNTNGDRSRKPRVHVFAPSKTGRPRGRRYATMAELRTAVRKALGFGPGWVSPDAWPEREELEKLPQRRARDLLDRLQEDLDALRVHVRQSVAFVGKRSETDGPIGVLRKWLEVYHLSALRLPSKQGEVSRFVEYNDALADSAGAQRMTDRELGEALLRTGWWPATKAHASKLTVSAIVKLATNAVRKARSERDTETA